jgi:hypothetical protein
MQLLKPGVNSGLQSYALAQLKTTDVNSQFELANPQLIE